MLQFCKGRFHYCRLKGTQHVLILYNTLFIAYHTPFSRMWKAAPKAQLISWLSICLKSCNKHIALVSNIMEREREREISKVEVQFFF